VGVGEGVGEGVAVGGRVKVTSGVMGAGVGVAVGAAVTVSGVGVVAGCEVGEPTMKDTTPARISISAAMISAIFSVLNFKTAHSFQIG
jgi:hypothetical protein